eukprot:5128235-Amphidinium_carterae.1
MRSELNKREHTIVARLRPIKNRVTKVARFLRCTSQSHMTLQTVTSLQVLRSLIVDSRDIRRKRAPQNLQHAYPCAQ